MNRRRLLAGAAAVTAAAAALKTSYDLGFFSKPDNKVEFIEYEPPQELTNDPLGIGKHLIDLIARESDARLVILDFFADWCPACHELSPKLIPAAQATGEDVLILKVDMEKYEFLQPLKQEDYYPEIQLYKDREMVAAGVGNVSQEVLTNAIKRALTKWREGKLLREETIFERHDGPSVRL